MRDTPRRPVTLALALLGAALAAGGCATDHLAVPVTDDRALRLHNGEIAFEALPELDRLTYFGPVAGPNLLFVQLLETPPPADGAYTFYGGCYTWVAPQNPVAGAHPGWLDAEGASRPWPPDPAMDVGPADLVGRSSASITTQTPTSAMGLKERKRFELVDERTGRLVFTIQNLSDERATVAPWINTAVRPEAVAAVRYQEGITQVWGWDEDSISRFRSILRPDEPTGWALVDLQAAEWERGIKVYLDGAPEIAIWQDGWWLHRSQRHDGGARLRSLGEGPVAMYIEPSSGPDDAAVIEAELYGSVSDLPPFTSATTVEAWRLIEAPTPDLSLLSDWE
jgi:hypothetical protein